MSSLPNPLALKFIINGEDTWVKSDPYAPVAAARARALSDSGNSSRPEGDWEIRNEAGQYLDPTLSPADLHLKENTALFLSLKVGAGG